MESPRVVHAFVYDDGRIVLPMDEVLGGREVEVSTRSPLSVAVELTWHDTVLPRGRVWATGGNVILRFGPEPEREPGP